MLAAIPFPDISPNLVSIEIGSFTFALRWYALAYIAGIIIGWRIVVRTVNHPEYWSGGKPVMTKQQVEEFEPLPTQGANILNTATSEVLEHLKPSFGVFAHYADDLFRLVSKDPGQRRTERIIKSHLKAEIWASVGFFDVFELGLVLPLTVFQDGDSLASFGRAGDSLSGFSLGDLRIVPKIRIIDPRWAKGFGLAFLATVHLPTGDEDAFQTPGTTWVAPRLAADWFHEKSGFRVAANVAVQSLKNENDGPRYITDDDLRWYAGLQIPVGYDPLKLLVSGQGSFAGTKDKKTAVSSTLHDINDPPIEVAGALQYRHGNGFLASIGGSAGLTNAAGAPDWRAFLAIGYTPHRTPEDLDADDDGILDEVDKCVHEPEDKDGFQDSDGCPDPDNDGDGILDAADKCPIEAEDKDGFQDSDGCPDPDNDGDGILDTADKCPNKKETVNEYEDTDGCPDTRPLVVVTEKKIVITQKVFFKTGSARIKPESFHILDAVAQVLADHPEIKKIQIEGHTDNKGKARYNKRLSARRAKAVLKYLVNKGVARSRLVSRGFGPDQPIADNATEAGRAANRRVEFKILQRDPPE